MLGGRGAAQLFFFGRGMRKIVVWGLKRGIGHAVIKERREGKRELLRIGESAQKTLIHRAPFRGS